MAIELNHTIVAAKDAEVSARWLAEMLGTAEPIHAGRFWQVTTANGVGLDFASVDRDDFARIHYAFLVSEGEFSTIYGRISERGLEHWADPRRSKPGEINHNHGGRGVYFPSNDGHHLEILTRRYGSAG